MFKIVENKKKYIVQCTRDITIMACVYIFNLKGVSRDTV